MSDGISISQPPAMSRLPIPRALRVGMYFGVGVSLTSVFAALLISKGFKLTVFGDTLQVLLVLAVMIFAFRNFLHAHSRVRIFWFLIFVGSLQWTICDGIWAFYEVLLARPVPDLPFIDMLLFLKVVPFTAAIAIVPDREH